MRFALDYDGTASADPELWLLFVINAQHHGHDVTIVTMRYESEAAGGAEAGPVDMRFAALGVGIVYTGRQAKAPYCHERGLVFDVWIDDNPRTVHASAAEVHGDPREEGRPYDPAFVKGLQNG